MKRNKRNSAVGSDNMSSAELDFLRVHLGQAGQYLEYGSGTSTIASAAIPSICKIVSVESDAQFFRDKVQANPDVTVAIESGKLNPVIVDIGDTGPWGAPKGVEKRYAWPNYVLAPYIDGWSPDTVLIDGRFRVACALAAGLAAPSATVLVHDYSWRPNYHVIERFFSCVEQVETLFSFRLKNELGRTQMARLLRSYQYSHSDRPQTLRLYAQWRLRQALDSIR